MKVDIKKLSKSAQVEMLQNLEDEDLHGLVRLAGLNQQKNKKLAAEALVDSGKLSYHIDFGVGLKAKGDSKLETGCNPDPARYRELQEWNDSIEIEDEAAEQVAAVISRQEADVLEEDAFATSLPISPMIERHVQQSVSG